MQACVHMSNHGSEFMCLVSIITCMHPLELGVLLCTLPYQTIAVQHESLTNEDLMELEAQRKDKCRQEEDEQTEEQKKYTTQKMTRGISLFREALLVLGGLGPECQTVQKSCSSHSEQSPVLPHHLWWEKKNYFPDVTGSFFQEGR